jgi:thioredoxin 1
MASNSYKKYNDLGMTPNEKAVENSMHNQINEAQGIIKKQQEQIQELQNNTKMLMQNQNSHRPKRVPKPPSSLRRRAPQAPRVQSIAHAPRVQSIAHKKNLIENNEIVIFKISAPWCEPCKVLAPKYDALAKLVNSSGLIMLCAEELDDKFSADVEGVPAIDYYFRGNKIKRQMGADFNETRRHVRSLINQAKSLNSQSRARLDSPHPAAGMQPQRPVERPQVGSFPPSARRM